MAAIYKRELKSMFHSVIGYITLGVILIYFGFTFSTYNVMAYKLGSLEVTIGNSLAGFFILMLCFSVLTRRSFAEERKSKTDQLLLTAPVKVWDIVLGKYLAILTIFAIACAALLIYLFSLSFFGTIYINESLIILLGFFLYGAMCLALGLFISTLFENPIVCAVLSFVAMLVTMFMSTIVGAISDTGNFFTDILKCFDGLGRLITFLDGQLNLGAVIYYLTFIVLMLFLATQAIQKRRYTVSVKNMSFGAYSVATILVAIVIAVLLNIGITKIPTRYTYFDLSTQRLYKLSDDTKEVLNSLSEDINIIVFEKDEETYDDIVVEFLKQYEKSKHIVIKYIDPIINPKYYKQFTDIAPGQGAIIVSNGKKNRVIEYNDLYVYTSHFDQTTMKRVQEVIGFDIEGRITSAINYVKTEEMPKLYVLAGHDEIAMGTGFASNIEKANFEQDTLNLSYVEKVPEDAAVILINCPQSDLSKDDFDKLSAYVLGGGDLMVVLAPSQEDLVNFGILMALYGVSTEPSIVFDNNPSYYLAGAQYEKMFLLPGISDDEYKEYMGQRNVLMVDSLPIYANTGRSDVVLTDLMASSSSAYLFDLIGNDERTSYEQLPTDKTGSFCVGLKAELLTEGNSSIMYLVSAGSFLNDNFNEVVSGGNLRMFTKMITSFNQDVITIPYKSSEKAYLTVTAQTAITFFALTTVVLPLVLIICGIVIYVKRRRR